MPPIDLTEGAIEMISIGERPCEELKPVLQITDVWLMNSQNLSNNCERYRILISDGQYIQQGILATQKNDLVRSQRIQKGTIFQMKEFVRNLIQHRVIIIIIELDILLETCDQIGEPKHYLRTDSSTPSVPRPAAPPQPSTNQLVCVSVNPQSFTSEGHSSGMEHLPDSVPSSAPAALQDSSKFQIARLLLENERLRLDNENLRAQIARNEELATARHNDLVTMIKGLSRTTTPSTSSLAQSSPPANAIASP